MRLRSSTIVRDLEFSTYAQSCRFVRLSLVLPPSFSNVAIPVHLVETINKYAQVTSLAQELGREPLAEEIAAEMNIEVEKIRHIQKISQEQAQIAFG